MTNSVETVLAALNHSFIAWVSIEHTKTYDPTNHGDFPQEQSGNFIDAVDQAIGAVNELQLTNAQINDIIEMCASAIEPIGKRSCPCTYCDCGNLDDATYVATWDEAKVNAATIRSMKRN